MRKGIAAVEYVYQDHTCDAEAIRRLEHLRRVAMSLPDNITRRVLIDTVDDFVERLTDPERELGGIG